MSSEDPTGEQPGDALRPAASAAVATPDSSAPEDREREGAWRRGKERERERTAGREYPRSPQAGRAPKNVAAQAFAALAENVRDYAIFLLNPAGVITFWGEGARLIKWWTKEEAEGAHLRLLYPAGGSDDGTAEEHLVAAAEQGEYTGEGMRVRSDCSTFWAGVTLTALRDEAGTLLGFAKVTRDLTARRAADALLQAAAAAADQGRAAAEGANAAKGEFLATVSHEIRTPLNAILGYMELLGEEIGGPLTHDQRRYLVGASRASRHLLTLIDEVLDFSRLEIGRNTVTRARVRIGDAVSHALGLVAPQARAKGIDLTNAVGTRAAGLSAWADESRVHQILVNLLGNAVKFTTRRDGEPARITVSAGTAIQPSPDTQTTGDGPWVYVRVEDTGTGIPSERLSAIFEPFVQADMKLTRTHGGAGLGLAISRRLARLMGGDVTARSEMGVGSTFFLWLPAAPIASLTTGGLEGHGPGGEAPIADIMPGILSATALDHESATVPPVGTLRRLADGVLAEIEEILHTYVARLRSDPATPSAHAIDESLIEDHLATFLADAAGTLANVDVGSGAADDAARDGTAIQRVIAERHGAQRARLGWTEAELRREFTVLREELAGAIQRRAPDLGGPTPEAGHGEAERAMELLDQMVVVSERISLRGYARARADRDA